MLCVSSISIYLGKSSILSTYTKIVQYQLMAFCYRKLCLCYLPTCSKLVPINYFPEYFMLKLEIIIHLSPYCKPQQHYFNQICEYPLADLCFPASFRMPCRSHSDSPFHLMKFTHLLIFSYLPFSFLWKLTWPSLVWSPGHVFAYERDRVLDPCFSFWIVSAFNHGSVLYWLLFVQKD